MDDTQLLSLLTSRLEAIRALIDAHSPHPDQVRLMAVSKYVGAQGVTLAYQAGARLFGENRLQDAQAKWQQLPAPIQQECSWHLIGPLQTNKLPKLLQPPTPAMAEAVDSFRIAEALSARVVARGLPPFPILLEVNVSGEATKHGFSPQELPATLPALLALPGIHVQGLMTMAPLTADETQQHQVFGELRRLRDRYQDTYNHPMPILSMGMSRDLRTALAEGSTLVRVGRGLFEGVSTA
jgi:PLP dependent protein